MRSDSKDLTCAFLPGKLAVNEDAFTLYNASYDYWRKTWGEIFLQSGSPSSLNAENFLRQDLVLTLHKDSTIAALLTICFFNLGAEPTYDHNYLKPFPASLINRYREEGKGFAATFEYLSVHPDFRRNKIGVSLSEVLIGLGLKISHLLQSKITLATTVRPARVHESGEKFGWVEAGSVTKYGLDCLLLYNTPQLVRAYPDENIINLIENFWSKREDFTKLTTTQKDSFRRAA